MQRAKTYLYPLIPNIMSNSQLVTLWECLFILQGVCKKDDLHTCDRADLEDAVIRIYDNLNDLCYQH